MNWYALNGRAYTRMGRADFQEAIADLRLAMLASKGDRGIIEQYLKLRLAKGDPTEVEQELRGQVEGVKPAEVDWGAASCLVQLLGAQGRDQEAGDLMERLANIAKKLDPDHAQSYSGRLRADYLYARGKIKELCLLAKGQGANSSGEEPALWCAFASGQPARAEGIISQPADFARHNIGSLELLLSLLYQQKNDMAAAKKWEKKALDKYIKWEPSMVLFKEMMQGSAPVTAVNLERLSLAPDDRAVALTALALARPESRNMLLEEAKRFNLPPAFPCRFLNSFQQ
jgi:tetratricopeptide (TPR) repeat protein